jgi:ribosomal protein L40E
MMVATVRPALTDGVTATELAVSEWQGCRECLARLPLDAGHFQTTYRRKTDGVMRYRHICRRCEAARVSRRDRELRTNPETRDAYLAKRREITRDYEERHPEQAEKRKASDREYAKLPEVKAQRNAKRRQRYAADIEASRARGRERYHRNPERSRQILRETYARRKADPARWARYAEAQRQWSAEHRDQINENRRIWHRLKAEQEGRQVRGYRIDRRTPETMDSLTVHPIAPVVARLVDAYGMHDVAVMTNLSARLLARIVANEPDAVIAFDSGDQLCCALGYNLFDFWPDYA